MPQTTSSRKLMLTIAIGIALIVIVTPLSMFLTSLAVTNDLEVGSPVGWAVGLVCSALLLLAPLRFMQKREVLERPQLVLLYSMFTIAAPLMNIGLVRPIMMQVNSVLQEYVYNGNQ